MRTQFLANESQIVVRIGIVRIPTYGLPEVLSCCLEFTEFFHHTSQIEMRQSVFGIQRKGAPEVLRRLFEIPILVVERPAIDQYLGPLRINAQSSVIRIDGFGPVLSLRFILECSGQPFVGIAAGHDAHSFVKLASLEMQYELTRQRFQPRSIALHYDIFSIGENA